MPQSRFLPLSSTSNSTGYRFLTVSDITDSLAQDFVNANDVRIDSWLDLVDGEIMSLAQERDVPLTSIIMPLHKKILEFAKCYFCVVCFQDTFGRNDIAQTSQETIKLKLSYYIDRCNILRKQCTKEMFLYTNLGIQASQRTGGTISLLRS